MIGALEIARATPGDVESLAPLVRGYREFYGRVHDERGERARLERNLQDGSAVVFIARANGEAVGFVQLFAYPSTVWLRPTLILEDLFVAREARRSGVAAALLTRARAYAAEIGAAGMFLETALDNVAAQRLYERCGWTPEGTFRKYNAPLDKSHVAESDSGEART